MFNQNTKPRKKIEYILNISFIVTTIIICTLLIADYKNIQSNTEDTRPKEYFREIDATNDLILGNPDADIFIVEYGDLECPYCREFHNSGLAIMKSHWGISGRVAWVWRHGFHINDVSLSKALTLECVRKHGGPQADIKAWEFIQESLVGGVYETIYPFERYQTIYKRLDLPGERIEQCRKNAEETKRIQEAVVDIARLKIEETPHLQLITKNGTVIYNAVGALTEIELEQFIAQYFSALN